MDVEKLIEAAERCDNPNQRTTFNYALSNCSGCPGFTSAFEPYCCTNMRNAKKILALRDHYEALLSRQAELHDKICAGYAEDMLRNGRKMAIEEVRGYAERSIMDMDDEKQMWDAGFSRAMKMILGKLDSMEPDKGE